MTDSDRVWRSIDQHRVTTPDGQALTDGPCFCNVECLNDTEDVHGSWCTCRACHENEYRELMEGR